LCSELGTLSGGNLIAEGFDSCRIAERAPVGMSALTLTSGGNPINRVYNTVLRVGKSHQRRLLPASEWEKSHHRGAWIGWLVLVGCIALVGCTAMDGCTALVECTAMDGCTVMDGCTAIDGCIAMVRSIK